MGNSGLASGVCMQKSDWFYYLYSRLAKRVVARMRRWSLIRRRAPVAQRLRQSRQQVGQCLSRDEGRAALPHIMCFFTALPQILSLHCRFCLVANVFAEYCLLSFAASSRHCRFCVLFAFFGNKVWHLWGTYGLK